jgi:hypothetical protein
MARQERGIYEPSDEVRVFDGVEDDEDDAEGSRLPLLIVLALVVLCAFAGVVWLAYTQGVARGRTETPVLAAAPGPERTAPANPGGAEVPYQGFKIYEQPAPSHEGDTGAAAPAPAAPPAPKPAPPAAFLPQAQKPPAPAPVPAAPPAATAKPAPTPPPATRPTVTAAAPAPTAKPAAPAATAKPPAPVAASAGGTVIQIGAFKSQAEADAAWKVYSARHGALVKGYSPNVLAADLGEKGTWYRLRIAGFTDRDVAAAVCDRLKAQGGACIIGR